MGQNEGGSNKQKPLVPLRLWLTAVELSEAVRAPQTMTPQVL